MSVFPASSTNIQGLLESLPFPPAEILRAAPLKDSAKEGYSAIYQNSFSIARKNQLFINIHPSLRTLHDLFANAVKMYPANDCMGKRLFGNTIPDAHDPFYTWESFAQIDERKRAVGSGILHTIRTSPFRTDAHNVEKFIVSLYSGNRTEWLLTDLACLSYSLTNTALYDTLGPDTSHYILSLTALPIVVCAKEKIPIIFEMLRSNPLPLLVALVSMDPLTTQETAALNAEAAAFHLQVMDLSTLEAVGRAHPLVERPPNPDDLYTISFTSGTTGNPKGVEVHHEMGVSGVTMYLAQADVPKGKGHEMCFLPLAHIYERGVVAAYLSIGVGFGFPVMSSPLTLVEELKALKPTTVECVPRVFSRIEADIKEATVNSENLPLRNLSRQMVADRAAGIAKGKFTNDNKYTEIFTTELKKKFGLEDTKFLCTASAPISPDTMAFFKSALNIGFSQAYGLTETFGIMCMSNPFESDAGSCGFPGISGEMRLRDVPLMGYTAADEGGPRGELLLRGPQIFKRYYKNKEATDECFDDGWFCTGDIARLDANGQAFIVDRVKAFQKLSHGEYISPEKLETSYIFYTSLLSQLYIHGDPLQNFLVAIAGYDVEVMARFLREQFGVDLDPETQAAEIDAKINELPVKTRILQTMNRDVAPAKLAGFEKIHNIWFEREPLTVEREVYTPTFKLKRPLCRKFFDTQLTAMYAEGSILKGAKL